MADADMSLEQVRMLADLVGVPIDDADLPEVANRFASLMQELDRGSGSGRGGTGHHISRLRDLDLEGVEPVTIFPDSDGG